jgi:hypothetical protein
MAQIASDDHDGARDQWIAVELERSSFFAGVVLPDEITAPAVQRAKVPVTRSDEDEVARDRGC